MMTLMEEMLRAELAESHAQLAMRTTSLRRSRDLLGRCLAELKIDSSQYPVPRAALIFDLIEELAKEVES